MTPFLALLVAVVSAQADLPRQPPAGTARQERAALPIPPPALPAEAAPPEPPSAVHLDPEKYHLLTLAAAQADGSPPSAVPPSAADQHAPGSPASSELPAPPPPPVVDSQPSPGATVGDAPPTSPPAPPVDSEQLSPPPAPPSISDQTPMAPQASPFSGAALDPNKYRLVTAAEAPLSPSVSLVASLVPFVAGLALAGAAANVQDGTGLGALMFVFINFGPNLGDALNGDVGRMGRRGLLRIGLLVGSGLLLLVGLAAGFGGSGVLALGGVLLGALAGIGWLGWCVYDVVDSFNAPARWAEHQNERIPPGDPVRPLPHSSRPTLRELPRLATVPLVAFRF